MNRARTRQGMAAWPRLWPRHLPWHGGLQCCAAAELSESISESSNCVVERILEGIGCHPCVYGTKRIDYRGIERKGNTWEAIRQCGLDTVEECQKLWKRLRDLYTREAKAVDMATRSGSGFVSRTMWQFTKFMEFYKNCGRPRKTSCNLQKAPAVMDHADTSVEAIFSPMQQGIPSSAEIISADIEQVTTAPL